MCHQVMRLLLGACLLVGIARMQASAASKGIWISPVEVSQLPTSGAAWDRLQTEADKMIDRPNLSLQNSPENTRALAKALVYARTGKSTYRHQVLRALKAVLGTETGGRTLALGRNLAAYVIAADLIDLLTYDPSFDQDTFRPWLRTVRYRVFSGKTLVSTHEVRPNNWGTAAGASRAAVAAYLGDTQDLQRTAQVFRGWLGNRNAYNEQLHPGFKYRQAAKWQCHPEKPVGINPRGCRKQGHSIDGVLPDDLRRAGPFTWPPPKENYVYTALEGAIVQAEILYRAGFDTWHWADRALLRAYQWLYTEANFPPEENDTWQPWLINFRYGTRFSAITPAQEGKIMGWTDWTHAPK